MLVDTFQQNLQCVRPMERPCEWQAVTVPVSLSVHGLFLSLVWSSWCACVWTNQKVVIHKLQTTQVQATSALTLSDVDLQDMQGVQEVDILESGAASYHI